MGIFGIYCFKDASSCFIGYGKIAGDINLCSFSTKYCGMDVFAVLYKVAYIFSFEKM